MRATAKYSLFLCCAVLAAGAVVGQNPTPPLLIVQAANAPTPAPKSSAPTQASSSLQEIVRLLQQIKAANNETLNKQQAALERLDEMQKAADQLKIFSHRTGG